MEPLKETLRAFVRERDWERFHEPKDLALAVGIEAGELGEHFLWKDREQAREHVRDPAGRAALLDEIADVMIYCLNLVNAIERISGNPVDVEAAVRAKIAKNEIKYPAAVFKHKARLER